MSDPTSILLSTPRQPSRRILLIGGGREGLDLLDDARALGLSVIMINSKAQFRDAFLSLVEHAFITDYRNIEVLVPIARALQSVLPFDVAISLSEEGLLPAAQISDALGLPGNSLETVRLLKDKAQMRARLDQADLSPVLARIGRNAADIKDFIDAHGAPVIVKPVDGARSFGVYRVGALDAIDDVITSLAAADIDSFLIEEYLDGPEISVEAFSFAGHHVIMAVTDKLILDNHVEIGHSMPSRIDAATQREVASLSHRFLDVVGLQDGPSHTEIKLTSKGPRIIESHNRVGGDRINELVRVAYGVNMKALALAWSCGLADAMHTSPPLLSAVAIRFFAPPPGLVTEIRGADRIAVMPGFVESRLSVRPGDRIKPIRSSDDRAGHVIAGGGDAAEAIERCERMARAIEIITVDLPSPSCAERVCD